MAKGKFVFAQKDIQRRYKFCNTSADVVGSGISVVVVVVVVIGPKYIRTEGCVDKLMDKYY